MRKVKKLIGVLLAAVMVLAMGVPTFAAENYTISAPDNDHTYEVYQVFTGDYSEGVLSNVKWGQNGTGTTGENVDKTTLDALMAVNAGTDKEQLKVIEQYVNLNSEAFATIEKDADPRKVTVPAGYYLIKDKDGSVSGDDSYTLYIVQVVGDVTITPKSDVPEFEKKVQDINDSKDNDVSGWQDSADHDIGDMVNFQLKGTVADNYDNYEAYKFIFHDRESAGLTFDSSSVKVYVDNALIQSGYQVVTEGLEDGCTFEIRFADLKDIPSVHAGSVITVEYQSKLNENAVIGSVGNPNTANLEFSNNPNDEQGGETGTTPDDTVIVFTFKTIINKKDGENKPLDGAAFQLEKFVASEEGSDTYNGVKGNWTVIETIEADDNKTTFEFRGLDDGIYRLTETTTPDGFNTMAPIIFEITANHQISADNPQLISLNGNKLTGKIEFTTSLPDGSLSADVINQKGSTLPETGGMGTTIFYVLGAILVIGAGVLLIVRRRTGSEK